MKDCIFCKIFSGDTDASVVYQDHICTAFLTIEPVTQGHTLVIPNAHYKDVFDLPSDVAGHMFQVAKKVASSFNDAGLRSEGVNIVMCNGVAASQTVFHAHIHVNPRFSGDGFSWNLPPDFHSPPARPELDLVAEKIRQAIGCAT